MTRIIKIPLLIAFLFYTAAKLNGSGVYMRLSSETLFAGEELWFSAWLDENAPGKEKQFLKIDLLTPENVSIIRKIIPAERGHCFGKLLIPSGISSGFYILRAYTGNAESEGFQRKLIIMNPLLDRNFRFIEVHDAATRNGSPQIITEGKGILLNAMNRIWLYFSYPRSGNEHRLVMKDQNHDTLALETSVNSRLSYFDFHPVNRQCYIDHSGFIQNIPPSLFIEEGPGLWQSERPGGYYFTIQQAESQGSVRIMHQNGHSIRKTLIIEKGGFQINSEDLKPGFNKIELSIREEEDPAFAVVYKPAQKYNTTNIVLRNETILRGSSTSVLMGIKDRKDKPVQGTGTIVIRLAEPDLLPSSGLEESLQIPGLNMQDFPFCEPDDPEVMRFLGYLTSGCTYSGSMGHAEGNGGSLTGRYGDRPGENLVLSIPGKTSRLSTVTTDSSGRFSFSLPRVSGKQEVIISAVRPGNQIIETYPQFSATFPTFKYFPEEIPVNFREFAEKKWTGFYYSVIFASNNGNGMPGHTENKAFYGKPDFTLNMKDYLVLPLMEEVFFELVKPVMVLRKDKQVYLKVIDKTTNRTIDEDPFYLVDGVPVRDVQKVMEMSPSELENISILAGRYYLGNLVFGGIVDIRTKKGQGIGLEDKYNARIQITGLSGPEKPALMNPPSMQKSNVPGFSPLLYWNPEALISKEGIEFEFTTGELRGTFEIIVEGITEEGLPFSGSRRFVID